MGSSAWTSKVCGLALLLAWGCGGGDSGGGGGGTGGSPREPSDATPLPLPFDAAGGGNYQSLINAALRRAITDATEPLEAFIRRTDSWTMCCSAVCGSSEEWMTLLTSYRR